MTTLHDAEVRQRFDEQAGRFKAVVPSDDIRLNAVLESWLDQRKRSEKRLLRKAENALVRMAASANDLFQR